MASILMFVTHYIPMEQKSFVVRENEESLIEAKEVIGVIRRAKWVILGVALLAALGTYVYNLTLSDYYQVRATMMSSEFSSRELMPALNTLANIAEGSDDELLASKLGVSEEVAAQVNSISFSNASSDHGLFSCTVNLNCSDPSKATEVLKGLKNYLEQLEYFSERLNMRKAELQLVVDKSREELKVMEAFKAEYNKFNEIEGLAIYPANIHSEYLEILERTQKRQMTLDQLAVVYYLNAPNVPNAPSGPKALRNSLAAFFLALLLSMPVAVLRHYFS